MNLASHTFSCQQGDTFRQVLELHQNVEGGPLLDLSGYTARMQIRDGFDGAVSAELSTVSGGIVIEASDGLIILTMSAAQTAELSLDCETGIFPPTKNYVYDLEITSADGVVTTILRGYFSVIGGVTR
jgi:hypothetical protein